MLETSYGDADPALSAELEKLMGGKAFVIVVNNKPPVSGADALAGAVGGPNVQVFTNTIPEQGAALLTVAMISSVHKRGPPPRENTRTTCLQVPSRLARARDEKTEIDLPPIRHDRQIAAEQGALRVFLLR